MANSKKPLKLAFLVLLGTLLLPRIFVAQSSNPSAGQASRVSENSIQSVILVDRLPACTAANKFVTCADWTANTSVDQGTVIAPSAGNPGGYQFRAVKGGTSANSEPANWPQATETNIDDGTITWENIGETIHRHRIEIQFSSTTKGLIGELDQTNVHVTTMPSGTIVALPTKGTYVPGWGNQMVQFDLSRDARTPPGDTSVKVCFDTLSFTSNTVANLCATGKVYNDSNIGDLVSDTLNAITKAVSSPKTTPEKSFFGGFNITAPSGGGSTQGSADISFNHTFWNHPLTEASLFDQAIVNFQLMGVFTSRHQTQ
jgi:hypothetical protein